MADYSELLAQLIAEFGKLPGVGPKTAERFAFHLLKGPREGAEKLARAILDTVERMRRCSRCNNISERDPCAICSDPKRDASILCVVEQPSDVAALERPKVHRGLYYVLMGVLSPLDGVTPEALGMDRLLKRIKAGGVREVIIATNPSTEGETTAVYLAKVIPPLGAKVSRIACGIPVGSGLGYVDEATLREALKGRRELTS